QASLDCVFHTLQRGLGDPYAGRLLLGHRGEAGEKVGIPFYRAGDEFHLRLLPGADRDQGMARSRFAEFYRKLRVPRRPRRDSTTYSGAGGLMVCVLLALPEEDLF